MTALAAFQADLPTWRPAVEAWLDELPAHLRCDPALAGTAYLLNAPALVAVGAGQLHDIASGWVDWPRLAERAQRAGNIEAALVRAAHALLHDDPGPALGLMLLFPQIEPFRWAHAAGTVHTLVADRLRRHTLSVP